ncbi:MAG: hypothetical protein GY753_07650 [Gammaproteobacteria bacterium]|nr:hypothetical protein [Gammaproteobacteria bacterium]
MTQERYHYDESTDALTIEKISNPTAVLEANKRALNDFSGYKSEVFNKKAVIDEVALLQWLKQRGISYNEFMNNQAIVKEFINDPANACWLCIPGKV